MHPKEPDQWPWIPKRDEGPGDPPAHGRVGRCKIIVAERSPAGLPKEIFMPNPRDTVTALLNDPRFAPVVAEAIKKPVERLSRELNEVRDVANRALHKASVEVGPGQVLEQVGEAVSIRPADLVAAVEREAAVRAQLLAAGEKLRAAELEVSNLQQELAKRTQGEKFSDQLGTIMFWGLIACGVYILYLNGTIAEWVGVGPGK